tara:strand:+ start:132 stop:368 length:237 start_codon:yes stop_codon:yes gene_type:complete
MKTLKNNSGNIKRVDDNTAIKLVKSNIWKYCGKEEYKLLNKPKPLNIENDQTNIENRGLSDKKVRKERKLTKRRKLIN